MTPIGFVDDIPLLTYSKSTERNIKNLEKAYGKCLNWARTHGSRFNPEKSKLIHFIGRKREAHRASITLEGKIIKPTKSIKFLGAHLDEGLTHKAHLTALNTKIPTLLSALKSITASTWGTSLTAARTLYRGAIRLVLAYGALSWCPENLEKAKTLARDLQSIQGRFLRAITGAYRATSIEALEVETFTEPLDLYIEKIATQGASRQVLRGYGNEGRLYKEILRNRHRRRGRPSPPSNTRVNSGGPRDFEHLKKPEIHEAPDTTATNAPNEERTALPDTR